MQMDERPTLRGIAAVTPPSMEERLGEWLVNRGLVSRSALFAALNVVYREGCRLGDALVELGLIERPALEREAGRFGAALRRRATPPPLPADALRARRATPPPLPADALRARRATPPPLPARAHPLTPGPDSGPVYLLTRRKR